MLPHKLYDMISFLILREQCCVSMKKNSFMFGQNASMIKNIDAKKKKKEITHVDITKFSRIYVLLSLNFFLGCYKFSSVQLQKKDKNNGFLIGKFNAYFKIFQNIKLQLF